MKKNRWLWVVTLLSACTGGVSTESASLEGGPVGGPVGSPTPTPVSFCDSTQAFGTPSHTGRACPELTGLRVVQDPDAGAENDASGFLQIHESPPLTWGDWVVIPSKRGFTSVDDRTTEVYSVQAFHWSPSATAPNATLVSAWSADTDWSSIDAVAGSLGSYTNGYVQQFAPAIANLSVYVPARAGTLRRVDILTGAELATIDPLAGTVFSGDDHVLVKSAVSTDDRGNLYYTVVALPSDSNRAEQPRASWLVHVRPNNTTRVAEWSTIATSALGVPQTHDLCEYPFGIDGNPPFQPSGPNDRAPKFGCGTQRPALNSPVAIAPNGHLWAHSYSNNAPGIVFLIEIDQTTLTPIRAADTRNHLLHGCGVRLPILQLPDGTFFGRCAAITANGTTNLGFDPTYNGPVRFQGGDIMDSAPAVAPNGDVTLGGYDDGFSFGGEFDARGALVTFHSDGSFAGKNERFGWEVTPSVVTRSDGSFSYLQDENLYSDLDLAVAQDAPDHSPQTRGQIAVDFDSVAIDWLDAHIPFGPGGDHYAVNGQGVLVKFDAAGAVAESVDLLDADGNVLSMETLSGYYARDRHGRIYASYAGNVYVIDGGAPVTSARRLRAELTPATRAALANGQARKLAGVATLQPVLPQ
jgi:hypothetical protein